MMSRATPLGALPELRRELEARVGRHPTYPDLRNQRALVRAHSGDLDGALADLRLALQHNPNYQTALLNLAWLHSQRGEPRALRMICTEPPTQALVAPRQGHLRVLETLCAQGREAALGVVETSAPAAAPPADAWLELDRLWLLVDGAAWDAAEAQLARILTWKPGVAASFRAVGLLHSGAAGREAFAIWSRCFRGNPNVGCLLRECARIRARAGGDISWAELLHWGVTLSLDLCDYWMAVGAQHDLDGRDAEAERAFRSAVACDPASAQPHIKLGLLYSASGRPQEALAALERAAHLAPRYADVRYMLGLLHEELGAVDRAETHFRQALELHPRYAMAQLALGCLLESEQRDAEALALLEGARSAGLDSADVEARLALLYRRLGRPDAARRARARARRLAVPRD